MKKIARHILFIVSALLAFSPIYAQNPQQLFEEANHQYERQAYDSALNLYAQLITEGYHNKDLYYNAGNASYKIGQAGYAIYYYTKALQKAPGNKTITHNLHLAQIKAFNKTKHLPTIFIVRWWHTFLQVFSINTWVILSIISFWILLFFLGWNIWSISAPKWAHWLRIPILVLFCLFFIGGFFSLNKHNTHDKAIVVSTLNPLKQAPDNGSNDIKQLQEGRNVKILDSVANWTKIQLKDGTEGWVDNKELKVL